MCPSGDTAGMRAAVVTTPGGPEVLEIMDVPDPVPGPDEIRVRVTQSACNRADIMQRLGGYPDPVQRSHNILGLEYAGFVESVGDRVTRWSVGDRVMGIEAGGCNAELVVTHERMALAVPDNVADDEIWMAERLHWETCEVEGHEWVDRSRLGPDSGTEVHECLRCGYVWSHTWY